MAVKSRTRDKTTDRSDHQRNAIKDTRDQDDRRPGWQAVMKGKEQSGEARQNGDEDAREDQPRDAACPKPGAGSGQNHNADRHQGAERMKPTNKVHDHKRQKRKMGKRT